MLEKSSLEKHRPSLDLTTVTARGGTYAVASNIPAKSTLTFRLEQPFDYKVTLLATRGI
jgi:hypothetical protein